MTSEIHDDVLDGALRSEADKTNRSYGRMEPIKRMSRNEHFEQGHSPHEKFVDEIDPSLSVDHSPSAEDSRQEWIHNFRWPRAYLDESMNDANYQQSLQGNLRRMGFQDRVTLRRRGEPHGPVTNASLFPDWEGKVSSGDLHEWQVPIGHIVGYGHPEEGEVFVRHP